MTKVEVRRQFGDITLTSYDACAENPMDSFIYECRKQSSGRFFDDDYAVSKLNVIQRVFIHDLVLAHNRLNPESKYYEPYYSNKWDAKKLQHHLREQEQFATRFMKRGYKILRTYNTEKKIQKADIDYLTQYRSAYLKIGKQMV